MTLVFIFGVLGNISSVIVFLAPLPTFIKIYQRRSVENFQAIPYLVSLFSAMLWIYYAILKSGTVFGTGAGTLFLKTINSFGFVAEIIYIGFYVAYAPNQARMSTLKILLMGLGGFGSIVLISHFSAKGSHRVLVVGWICMVFSTSVFAAPLSIIRQVTRTKSVEFMPIYLSFFLTISAIMWLLYGIFLKDFYIMVPNILGLIFGSLQIVLYVKYRNYNTPEISESNLPEHRIDMTTLSTDVNARISEMSQT